MFCDHVCWFFDQNLRSFETNYLEIGVYKGESISYLAKSYPNKKIIGVDPFIEDGCTSHDSNKQPGEHLEEQELSTLTLIKDCPNVILFKMASKEFNQLLTDTLILELNVGCVFIDGDHHYDHVINDCEVAMKLIGSKEGLIAFDDVNLKEVRKAVREFIEKIKPRIDGMYDLGRNSIVLKIKAE